MTLIERDPQLEEQLRNMTQVDDKVKTELEGIRKRPKTEEKGIPEWTYKDGMVIHRGVIYVPKNQETC